MTGIVDYACYLPRARATAAVVADAGWRAPGVESVRVAAADEDAVTLAIAAVEPLVGVAAARAVVLASTTLPYHQRVQAGAVAERLGLDPGTFACELSTSARAGTEGLTVLAALVDARGPGLLVASETGRGGPAAGTVHGAGAVAFLLGADGTVGRVTGHGHGLAEYPGLDMVLAGEAQRRDVMVPGYAEAALHDVLGAALADLQARGGPAVEAHNHVVAAAPDRRALRRVLRRLGIGAERWENGAPYPWTGPLAAAEPLLGLAAALDRAEPGEHVLVLSYGGGSAADAISIEAGPRAGRGAVDAAGADPADLDLPAYLRLLGVM